VALSRIVELSVTRLRLVLPASEFVRLPAAMGVTVVREGNEVRLTTEQPQCSLRFHIEGDSATLTEATVVDDLRGAFFQQVLGALLIEYRGDLDGEVEWNQPKGQKSRVWVEAGETDYPLLASLSAARGGTLVESAPDDKPPRDDRRVEAHLESARAAWQEYQRAKSGKATRG
jgi:hypothetical protein